MCRQQKVKIMATNVGYSWRLILYTPILVTVLALIFLVLPERLSRDSDLRRSSKSFTKAVNVQANVRCENLTNCKRSSEYVRDDAVIDEILQAVREHTDDSKESREQVNESNNGSAMNFFREPNRFVSTFADCIEDTTCRIYYHHVGKTGGTTIEARMRTMFPATVDNKSCCFQKMLARFEERKKDYCSAKFTAYQVMGWGFEKIVSDCMSQNSKGSRAIALTSFREPIQRTLSNIHQNCNKNFAKRSNETKIVCDNCSYEKDKEVWDKVVRESNRVYMGIVQVSNMNIEHVDVMTIDSPDIDEFFHLLNATLPNLHVPLLEHENEEKCSRCSFGMTSPMLKALGPRESIYRNLTLGI